MPDLTPQPLEIAEPSARTPADRDPRLVYLTSLASGHSRRSMGSALARVARMFDRSPDEIDWPSLEYQHMQAIRSRLVEEGAAPATVNRILCALRGVVREAWRLGLVPEDRYRRIVDVEGVKGSREPRGRSLTPGELGALFSHLATLGTATATRDAAILALLYSCGLRRTELVDLELESFDTDTGALRVMGKGNRERTTYVTNGAADALADWLTLRGDAPGKIFLPIRKGGEIQHRPLTAQGVYAMLKTRARQAGVAEFSPHDLRRTCTGDLLEAGNDLSAVASYLGHQSVTTTQRYDRRGERAKMRAAGSLSVPYRRAE